VWYGITITSSKNYNTVWPAKIERLVEFVIESLSTYLVGPRGELLFLQYGTLPCGL